tara:strand:- start:852 stop:1352 length:501 start_codon:yes stop_codon:yes gene_type:complete
MKGKKIIWIIIVVVVLLAVIMFITRDSKKDTPNGNILGGVLEPVLNPILGLFNGGTTNGNNNGGSGGNNNGTNGGNNNGTNGGNIPCVNPSFPSPNLGAGDCEADLNGGQLCLGDYSCQVAYLQGWSNATDPNANLDVDGKFGCNTLAYVQSRNNSTSNCTTQFWT